MNALTTKTILSPFGLKRITVYCNDIAELDEPLDIMTISAFYSDYSPVRFTLLYALAEHGISVSSLSCDPSIDLRSTNKIWLSQSVKESSLPIARIGCIEMSPYQKDRGLWKEKESEILHSIKAYFHMIQIAALSGIKAETIGLPILGGGSQQIDSSLILIPMLNECIQLLKTCENVKEIKIITRSPKQAFQCAMTLEKSYSAQQEEMLQRSMQGPDSHEKLVFISYSSKDKNIADNLCAKFEAKGVKVWYAPRNISSVQMPDYASAIVDAITKCTHFVVIISRNSLQSEHVLNEIDLAFRELKRSVRLVPLRIDEEKMGQAFLYYLSRQHWMDARVPPLEKRLDEFVDTFLGG